MARFEFQAYFYLNYDMRRNTFTFLIWACESRQFFGFALRWLFEIGGTKNTSVWEWKSFKQDIRMNDGPNRNNELLSNHVVELCCLFWLAGIYLDSCIDLNVMRESMCLNSQLHYKIHPHTYIHYMPAQPYFCTFVRFFESLLLVFMPLFFPISTNLVKCHFLSS